jgi:hypothetical protein
MKGPARTPSMMRATDAEEIGAGCVIKIDPGQPRMESNPPPQPTGMQTFGS